MAFNLIVFDQVLIDRLSVFNWHSFVYFFHYYHYLKLNELLNLRDNITVVRLRHYHFGLRK